MQTGVKLYAVKSFRRLERQELVFVAERGSSYSGLDGNLMLMVFSASNGTLKWQVPLSREFGSVSNVSMPYQMRTESYPEVTFVDLNSDGCSDLIAISESPESTPNAYSTDIVALDGHSGQTLWKRSGGVSKDPDYAFSGASRIAVATPKGASRGSQVYFLNCEDVEPSDGTIKRYAKLNCYDAIQQRDLWSQSIEVDFQFSRRSQNRQDYLQPQTLKRQDGSDWIALRIMRDETNGRRHRSKWHSYWRTANAGPKVFEPKRHSIADRRL